MIRARAAIGLLAMGLLGPFGCDDAAPPPAPPAARAAVADGGVARGPGQNVRQSARDQPPPQMQITDTSFQESTAVRDPFRSFAEIFVSQVVGTDATRDVKLGQYTLDDLRLVAVIVGTDSPYAMVIDPTHTGTTLRRGMYVGRQEVVHAMNERGSDYAVHWRVARINPGRLRRGDDGQFQEVPAEVVFERQNPLDPSAQVVERSISLASGVAGIQQNAGAGAIGPIPGVAGATPAYLPANLGGVGGGSATSAILGTQAAAQQAVGGAPPPTQTTVVVQVPPTQPTVAPVAPSNSPPPIQVYNGSAANAPR